MKKINLVVVVLLVMTILLLVAVSRFQNSSLEKDQTKNDHFIEKPLVTQTQVTKEKNNESGNKENYNDQDVTNNQELSDSVNLEMEFIPQAPFANWDELHDETCEEASILLVHYYLLNQKVLSNEKADEEIKAMVDWQIKNYGSHHDLTVQETIDFVKSYYGYNNSQIYYDITIDDIKRQLADGNPVIVPAAGRKLGNPYFRQPGPIYHMLVIKGYDSKNFITNDVGTRRGENYQYNHDVLYNAIHDFVGKSEEEMEQGRKAMIIVKN